MRNILIVFIICFSISSCSNNEKGKKDIKNKDEIVTDIFTPVPFRIEKRPSIDLPDSLGGKEMTVKIVIAADIDSLGNVIDHEITTFVTSDIKYFGKKVNYPIEINSYENWINEYLSRIVFRRNKLAKIGAINRMLIPISLNSQ